MLFIVFMYNRGSRTASRSSAELCMLYYYCYPNVDVFTQRPGLLILELEQFCTGKEWYSEMESVFLPLHHPSDSGGITHHYYDYLG